MNAKEKKTLYGILIAFASILVIVYIAYQAYRIVYDPVDTEAAAEYTVQDTIETTAFVAREEKYITNKKAGTIIACVENGSRVAKNEDVALIFSDPESADNYAKMQELASQIARYQKLASQSDNYIFNIEDLDHYIDVAAVDLVTTIDEKDFANLPEKIYDFRNQAVTRQIATGTNLDFKARLASLQTQYDALVKKDTTHTSIKAADSGYFVEGSDGYEQAVDIKQVKNLTVGQVEKLMKAKPSAPPAGCIGKIITEFNWYLICNIDNDLIGDLKVGKTITVNLPFASINTVTAEVIAINENGKKQAAVILECNLMNSKISSLRMETAELVVGSYTGLKVPSSAVRVDKEGNKGVFVKVGNTAKFRKLEIIYTADEYVLTASGKGEEYVRMYDDIILKGKDLYDGKAIK